MNRPTARVSAFALSSLACAACVAAFAFAPGCSSEGGHLATTEAPVQEQVRDPGQEPAHEPAQEPAQDKVSSELRSVMKARSRTRVIVTLREAESLATGDFARSLRIDEARKNVVGRIASAGASMQVTHSWKHVAGFAADLDRAALDALAADPDVEHVQIDGEVHINLAQSVPLIQADKAHDAGYKASGKKVVVIDTGVAADHATLSGKVVDEHCFCAGSLLGGCCPNGSKEQSGAGSSKDDQGHGSHVAGIVLGVAPEAKIVGIKVLDSGGSGSDSDIISALDWVATNHPDAAAINMSLGGGTKSATDCDGSQTGYRDAINGLRDKGVITVVASGNDASSTGISVPACVGKSLSVGAVYDANLGKMAWSPCTDATTAPDMITCFSNSAANLDVLAPGSVITSVGYQGGNADMSGTSQATPHVAGAVAVLAAANAKLTADDIESILKSTGVSLTDARNSVTKPRIDVNAAVTEAVKRGGAE